ncbi:MAG: TetR/AcrR family transcriptional regulator [Anaerolineae bacterium]
MKNAQRRKETRAAILNAAVQCFARDGYEATSVTSICDRAGVSKGAFYYHFKTKQAVFLAVTAGWLADLEMALQAAAHETVRADEALLAMARMARAVLRADDPRLPILLEFWQQASRDEEVRAVTVRPYRSYHALFEELVRRGIAEGSFAPVDPALAAQVILSLASGLFLQGLIDPTGGAWERVSEDTIHVLLDGLRRR